MPVFTCCPFLIDKGGSTHQLAIHRLTSIDMDLGEWEYVPNARGADGEDCRDPSAFPGCVQGAVLASRNFATFAYMVTPSASLRGSLAMFLV